MKNYTLVKRFDDGYEVKRDEQGQLSCNCRGWIFGERSGLRPRTCQHLEQVNGLKSPRPAKVFELTDLGDCMGYPLIPLDQIGTYIDATKVYDLFVRGYSRTTITECCPIIKHSKNKIDDVVRWVQDHGRFVLPPDYYKSMWYSWTPEKTKECFKSIAEKIPA
jgi:hypothetical protein